MYVSNKYFAALVAAPVILLSAAWTAQVLDVTDLQGKAVNPLALHGEVNVLLFVRTDCPITNRYAPELRRIADEYASRAVKFWLVYPDPDQAIRGIEDQITEYHFPGKPVRDPRHELVREAHATTAPEAAVFDGTGKLVYHGRIDDQWVDVGKQRPAAQVHDLEDAIAAALEGKPVARSATRAVGCSLADIE